MLSKCANPSCSNQFLYLHRGKLFRTDLQAHTRDLHSASLGPEAKKPVRRAEYFWLCEECASSMTLVLEKGVSVKTRPLQRVRAAATAS